jgi:pimeloyl-ACP methyl ester carboxylesterase
MGAGAPVVVLEPGSGQFSVLVRALQRRVAAFTRVCSYDRAGYAWSDPAPNGRAFEARAEDLDKLLIAADIQGPYVIVANSYGGLLARTFAGQHPDRIAGMVLVDAAEEKILADNLKLLTDASASRQTIAILAEFGLGRLQVGQVIGQARKAGRLPELQPEDIVQVAAFAARPQAFRVASDEAAAYAQMSAAQRQPGGFGSLGDKPLVVLRHGRPFSGINAGLAPLEAGWREAQERLVHLSTNSRLVVATGNGHDIAVENPALVAGIVADVVAAVRSGEPLAGTAATPIPPG